MKRISQISIFLSLIVLISFEDGHSSSRENARPNKEIAHPIPIDRSKKIGFEYTFVDTLKYYREFNSYTVGEHCYRGNPILFEVPAEKFILQLNETEYGAFGRSIWDRYYVPSKWNFLLNLLHGGIWMVKLNQDSCTDIVLDTRYQIEKVLNSFSGTHISVSVKSSSGDSIGKFVLHIAQNP